MALDIYLKVMVLLVKHWMKTIKIGLKSLI